MTRVHGDITATISLTQDNRNLGNRRFGISIQYLRTMADHTGMFLVDARQIARHIFQRDNRNIERIAETDKTCSFIGTVAIQYTCQHHRLISNETDSFTTHAAKTDHNVGCPQLLYFQEVGIIHDTFDNVTNIVRLFRICRNHIFDVHYRSGFLRLYHFCTFLVIPRDKTNQTFNLLETLLLALCVEMSITGCFRMDTCTTQVFHRNIFAQHGLDHIRTCNKHLGDILYYKYEVR